MFHRDIQTPRRGELKIRSAGSIQFDEIRGVWTADETLSRVFDVIYQTRVTVFHRDIQTLRRLVENTTRRGVFLTKFEVFG